MPQALPPLKFYFDPISPYAWLASLRLNEIASAYGGPVEAIPILLAGLLDAHGLVGPVESPAKRDYSLRDVLRCSLAAGRKLVGPPAHPFNPLKALRMATAVEGHGAQLRFGCALLEATWARGEDPTKESVLRGIAVDCELDADVLWSKVELSETKQALKQETQAAIDAGVFGVPTFVVHDEPFWGCDRVDALLARLRGEATPVDEAQLEELLQRPAAAQRRAVKGAKPDGA